MCGVGNHAFQSQRPCPVQPRLFYKATWESLETTGFSAKRGREIYNCAYCNARGAGSSSTKTKTKP